MTVSGARSPLALRLAVGLYPAAYRRDRQDELSEVFCDVTAGAGRLATVREAVDLAGHGLRLRTGLTSSGIPGRLAAVAAPFAAGALTASPLLELYSYAHLWRHGYPVYWRNTAFFDLDRASLLLWLLAGVAALFGRWSAARLLGPLATLCAASSQVAALVYFTHGLPHQRFGYLAMGLLVLLLAQGGLWSLTLLAAPPDLLGPITRRGRAAWLGGLVVAGLAMPGPFHRGPFTFLYSLVPSETVMMALAACEVALLLVALPALLRGFLLPAASALALLPFGFMELLMVIYRAAHGATKPVCLIVLVIVAVAVAVANVWHPTVPDRRRPPAAD